MPLHPYIPRETRARIVELLKAGTPVVVIAAETGTHRNSITAIRKSENIPATHRGGCGGSPRGVMPHPHYQATLVHLSGDVASSEPHLRAGSTSR